MTDFVIENDIPLPKRSGGGGRRKTKYDFSEMEVGQSVFFQDMTPPRAASIVNQSNKRYAPARFAARSKLDETDTCYGLVGVRIFRVA